MENAEYIRDLWKVDIERWGTVLNCNEQCVRVCEEASPAGGPAERGHTWHLPELETCPTDPFLNFQPQITSSPVLCSSPLLSFPFHPLFSLLSSRDSLKHKKSHRFEHGTYSDPPKHPETHRFSEILTHTHAENHQLRTENVNAPAITYPDFPWTVLKNSDHFYSLMHLIVMCMHINIVHIQLDLELEFGSWTDLGWWKWANPIKRSIQVEKNGRSWQLNVRNNEVSDKTKNHHPLELKKGFSIILQG